MLLRIATLLSATAAAQPHYPGAEWERRSAAEAGFDSGRLQDAFDYVALDNPVASDFYCASVHRDGYLIQDAYNPTPNPGAPGGDGPRTPESKSVIFSTSKPVIASLIGWLEMVGLVTTEDAASDFIEQWVGGNSSGVTIDMLLRHDSGRFFYDWYLDAEFSQSMPSQTDYGLVLAQMHEPGSTYAYNQMAFQALERVITEAAPDGMDVPALTQRELWGPLSFETDTFWWAEGFEWPPDSGLPGPPTDPIVYGGMTTSCRDLARFCHLWLHKGEWEGGHRVFSDDFYEKALETGPRGHSTYHWSAGPNHGAGGAFDQVCSFNPENGVVVTRLGGTGNTGGGGNAAQFITRVMEALADPADRGSFNATRHAAEFRTMTARELPLERAAASRQAQH